MPSLEAFLIRQGRRFRKVTQDPRLPGGFEPVARFFDDSERLRRMEESEIHHDRPALAGVVKEFEAQPAIQEFFTRYDVRETAQFRQAVGVLVNMAMTDRGWRTTGKKGQLGQRITTPSGHVAAANRPYNTPASLSRWFRISERYRLPQGMPYRDAEALGASELKAEVASLIDAWSTRGTEQEQRETLSILRETLGRRHFPTEPPSS